MAGNFKSKVLEFRKLGVNGARKWEVRVKGSDTVVAYVFGQAGNGEYRYRMVSTYGRYSQQMNESGIVRALMGELNL